MPKQKKIPDRLYEVVVTETIVRKVTHFVSAGSETAAGNIAVARGDDNCELTENKIREVKSKPKKLT